MPKSLEDSMSRLSINQPFDRSGQLTIAEFFECGLPRISAPLEVTQSGSTAAKGTGTEQSVPPEQWREVPEEAYIDKARALLADPKVKRRVSEKYYPHVPESWRMTHDCVETNVTAAFCAFIWLAITTVLESYPGLLFAFEVTQTGARADLVLRFAGAATEESIAVIEFKRRGVVSGAEAGFTNGRLIGSEVKENGITGVAEGLSKQATFYAGTYGTRHVALFDWDAMFLWHFNSLPESIERSLGKKSQQEGKGTFCKNEKTIPLILLGFLAEAVQVARARRSGPRPGNPPGKTISRGPPPGPSGSGGSHGTGNQQPPPSSGGGGPDADKTRKSSRLASKRDQPSSENPNSGDRQHRNSPTTRRDRSSSLGSISSPRQALSSMSSNASKKSADAKTSAGSTSKVVQGLEEGKKKHGQPTHTLHRQAGNTMPQVQALPAAVVKNRSVINGLPRV